MSPWFTSQYPCSAWKLTLTTTPLCASLALDPHVNELLQPLHAAGEVQRDMRATKCVIYWR